MATTTTTTTSRLTQMQMRFHQKQQQERDQKRVELVSTSSKTEEKLSSSLGTGKVRQMFDERRHRVAGIDKSYPLQPLQPVKISPSPNDNSTTNSVINRKTTNSKTKVPPISPASRSRITQKHLQHYDQIDGKDTFSSALKSTSLFSKDFINGNHKQADDNDNIYEKDKFSDTIMLENEPPKTRKITVDMAKLSVNNPTSKNGTKKVAQRKVTPIPVGPAPPIIRSSNSSAKSTSSSSSDGSPARTMASRTRIGTIKLSSASRPLSQTAIPEGLVPCPYCDRNFLEDRIDKHKEICIKTKTKKRKVFDVVKHRTQGTEAEKYLKKGRVGSKVSVKTATSTATASTTSDPASKKSDWRRKHEEFINAIRAAKEMKAFLAKGGKLSDLPPPPPSENPDYVQCPHCSRRFNQAAAERHIPKCANFQHNKPKNKPAPATKKRC